MIAEDQEYEVEAILDQQVIDCQPHYLIKWKGLAQKCNKWEAISSLGNISEILKRWLAQRKQKADQFHPRQKVTQLYSSKYQNFRQKKAFMQNLVNQKKSSEKCRVIAVIDPSKITRICKLFTFKGTKCVQVQYQDGKHLNMKQQDVKKSNPMLLMEYYEYQNIQI